MLEKFQNLRFTTIAENTQCVTPDRGHKQLTLEDPAISVMTDHRIEKVHTCPLDRSLDRARKQMAEEHTSMLLVTNDMDEVQGIITANDIAGEKAINYMREQGKARDELKVKHLMTSRENLPALQIKDVLEARVGDVLHTLNDTGCGYVLVMSEHKGSSKIRGVFSAQDIARELKIFFEPSPGARTLAEFSKALSTNWPH